MPTVAQKDSNMIYHYQRHTAFYSLLCIFYFLLSPQANGQAPVLHQYTKAGIHLGSSTYHGDICPSLNCGLQFTRLNLNGSVRYHLQKQWFIKVNAGINQLSGNDASGPNPERNLSFTSTNFYLSISGLRYLGKYHEYERNSTNITPYVSFGLGGLFFNPRAELDGRQVELQPLQTEGTNYSRFTIFIPLSFGITYRLSKRIDIDLAYTYNFSFSDYLDDVSTSYVNNATLFGDAAILADRTFEGGFLPTQTIDGIHSEAGVERGNSSTLDTYSLFTIGISFDIEKHF